MNLSCAHTRTHLRVESDRVVADTAKLVDGRGAPRHVQNLCERGRGKWDAIQKMTFEKVATRDGEEGGMTKTNFCVSENEKAFDFAMI